MQNRSRQLPKVDSFLKRALAHPKRIEILSYLVRKRGGANGEELADALGLTVPLASYHLRVLHDADLIAPVQDRREQGEAERSYVAASALMGPQRAGDGARLGGGSGQFKKAD